MVFDLPENRLNNQSTAGNNLVALCDRSHKFKFKLLGRSPFWSTPQQCCESWGDWFLVTTHSVELG